MFFGASRDNQLGPQERKLVELIGVSDLEPEQAKQTSESNQSDAQKQSGATKVDWLTAGALCAFVLAVFWKTVFLGQPLAKLARLAEWDSIFSAYRTGVSTLMDPSLVQLMIPYYFTVAHLWQSGQTPLWNAYNAGGCPFIGDPQSTVFSPLHWALAFSPTLYTYNLILVAEFIISITGMYALARTIRLSRLSSVFSAIAFTFCPYIVWFHDLFGNGNALFPILFCAFARAAEKSSPGRIVTAGIAAAVILLCGHPEISAFGILLSSFLFLALKVLDAFAEGNFKPSTLTAASVGKRAFDSLKMLIVAGTIALFLAAPMIFPFLEYLKNSDTYKFGLKASACIPWQTLALNMLQPGFKGASLFLGVLAVLMIPLSALIDDKRRKLVLAFFVVGLVAEALTAKLFPFNLLLMNTALSSLLVNYFMPAVVLCLAVLAGFGLDRIAETCTGANPDQLMAGTGRNTAREYFLPSNDFIILCITAAIVIFVPLLLRLAHASLLVTDFDLTVPHMEYTSREWLQGLVFVASILTLIFTAKLWKNPWRAMPFALCALLGTISIMSAAKLSMPVQPRFEYPQVQPLTLLQSQPGRTVAIGPHVLRPDTNAVYGIRDLRTHNPMFPKRFLKYMETAGARLDNFNQYFDWRLSPLLDAASVNSILSQVPIESTDIALNPPRVVGEFSTDARWQNLKLASAGYAYEPDNRALFLTTKWQRTDDCGSKLEYYAILLDEKNQVIWFGDKEPVTDTGSTSIPLPADFKGRARLGLQLFDGEKQQFANPTRGNITGGTICILGDVTLNGKSTQPSTASYALKGEYDNKVRLYENRHAMPEAYTVPKVRIAADADDAIKMLASSGEEYRNSAIVEAQEVGNLPEARALSSGEHLNAHVLSAHDAAAQSGPAFKAQSVQRLENDQVVVESDTENPALLVLTDTFYPGWEATIDGGQSPLVHANYLFRGVFVPAGKHKVTFKYAPLTYYAGAWMARIGIAALLFFGMRNLFKALGNRTKK